MNCIRSQVERFRMAAIALTMLALLFSGAVCSVQVSLCPLRLSVRPSPLGPTRSYTNALATITTSTRSLPWPQATSTAMANSTLSQQATAPVTLVVP